MIALSGALLVVAIGLLLVRFFGGSVLYVYGCIGSTLLAGLALYQGVRQRADEGLPGVGGQGAGQHGVDGLGTSTAKPGPHPDTGGHMSLLPTAVSTDVDTVLILPDRTRYHRPSCRYVAAAPHSTAMTRHEAVDLGHQPCGVCRP